MFSKLDEIRRAIEHMPMRSKKGKLVKDYTFGRQSRRLEKELEALVDALVCAFFLAVELHSFLFAAQRHS